MFVIVDNVFVMSFIMCQYYKSHLYNVVYSYTSITFNRFINDVMGLMKIKIFSAMHMKFYYILYIKVNILIFVNSHVVVMYN